MLIAAALGVKPEVFRQVAYNLFRTVIAVAARESDPEPRAITFTGLHERVVKMGCLGKTPSLEVEVMRVALAYLGSCSGPAGAW